MDLEVFRGIMIPFLGTSLGASTVLFMRRNLSGTVRRALAGFAAGVMTAASIWSLIVPAIALSSHLGRNAFLPAAAGFWAGVLFLLMLDRVICRLHAGEEYAEGQSESRHRTAMLVLAVVLHNLPEGMAVVIAYAGVLAGGGMVTVSGALTLAVGIAIQNFPEGAIISMPLHAEGMSKPKSFVCGVLSGAVEPVGAILTILASKYIIALLPYLLSFAAGAMVCVVTEELIPDMSSGHRSGVGTILFAAGFTVMMALDVALG